MKLSFKPLAPVHRFYFILYILAFVLFDIALFVGEFDILLFYVILIYNVTVCIAYIFVRILYNVRYVIDGEYILKKRGKKVILKIKVDDIEAIYIKKAKWYSYFSFVLDAFLNEGAKFSHSSSISFVYYCCDIAVPEKPELSREYLKSQNFINALEYNEIFCYRQCQKICEAVVDINASKKDVIFKV